MFSSRLLLIDYPGTKVRVMQGWRIFLSSRYGLKQLSSFGINYGLHIYPLDVPETCDNEHKTSISLKQLTIYDHTYFFEWK